MVFTTALRINTRYALLEVRRSRKVWETNVFVSDGGYLLVTSAQKLGREKAKRHEIYKRCVNWDGGLPHCIFSKLKMISINPLILGNEKDKSLSHHTQVLRNAD